MKNNILTLLTIGFLIITVTSCDKKLDLTPINYVEESQALNTSADVDALLKGSYSDLGQDKFYGGRIFVGADLLGDDTDLIWGGTYQQFTQISNKAIPVDNSFVSATWLGGYTAINDANSVLSHLSVYKLSADKDRAGGEAKFIRGAAFFDLVRLYGKDWNNGDPTANDGVPLVLTPTKYITDSSKVKRNKVSEVYAQVISDLTDAEAILPTSNGFYATKYTAAAMLARVYLQKGDYAIAAMYEVEVLGSGAYTLTTKYADEFPVPSSPARVSNTTEDIFAMQVTPTTGINEFNTFYSANSRGDITITAAHLSSYEAGDDRLNLFYSNSGSNYTSKFDNLYGNVHIIRLAEMYLIRAESNYRLGTSVGATPIADINVIRARVNLTPKTTITLDDILKERRLELDMEGFKLHDVKRLKQSVGSLPYTSPKLVYPIPYREILVNPNLTQNEGYK